MQVEHVRRTARDKCAAPVFDTGELNVADVDRDLRPRFEPERAPAGGGADRQQVVDREHVASA